MSVGEIWTHVGQEREQNTWWQCRGEGGQVKAKEKSSNIATLKIVVLAKYLRWKQRSNWWKKPPSHAVIARAVHTVGLCSLFASWIAMYRPALCHFCTLGSAASPQTDAMSGIPRPPWTHLLVPAATTLPLYWPKHCRYTRSQGPLQDPSIT